MKKIQKVENRLLWCHSPDFTFRTFICMTSLMTSQMDQKILDNIFLKTTVFRPTKLLDPEHKNPV